MALYVDPEMDLMDVMDRLDYKDKYLDFERPPEPKPAPVVQSFRGSFLGSSIAKAVIIGKSPRIILQNLWTSN